jgi:hypothetical protein
MNTDTNVPVPDPDPEVSDEWAFPVSVASSTNVTSTHSLGISALIWGSGAINATANAGTTETTLHCVSCHDPHVFGETYRMLKIQPSDSSIDFRGSANFTYVTDQLAYAKANPESDVLAYDTADYTVVDYASPDVYMWDAGNATWVPMGVVCQSQGSTVTVAKRSQQLRQWCAACHERHHAEKESREAVGSTDTGDAIYSYRHKTGDAMAGATEASSCGYDGAGCHGYGVPEKEDLNDQLGCLGCHVAHGTAAIMNAYAQIPWPGEDATTYDGLPGTAVDADLMASPDWPWDAELDHRSSLLRLDNRGVCQNAYCHQKGKEGAYLAAGFVQGQDFGLTQTDEGCFCHNMGADITECTGCHSLAQGSRRQSVGAGGDFSLASHHVQGEPDSEDCRVCHYTGNHAGGTVKLLDADDTSVVYDYTDAASLEGFCLSCHDGDGAADSHVDAGTPLDPFGEGDGSVLGDAPYPYATRVATSWAQSFGHGTNGNHGGEELTCMGTGDPGTGCHGNNGEINAHGSANEVLAARQYKYSANADVFVEANYELCFTCHASYPGVTKEDTFGVLAGGLLDGAYGPPGPNGNNPPYYTSGVTTHYADHNEAGDPYGLNDPAFWGPSDTNLHWFHIGILGSNFRGTGTTHEIMCTNCHDMHGSSTPYGAAYDEMSYTNFSDVNGNVWGQIQASASTLGTYPTYCSFNCHAYQGTTRAWFEPIVE